jgi:DNA-binding transcriptional ArsR family regulator
MSNLKTTIDSLAVEFANKLIAAIKGASFEEIINVAGGSSPARSGRRPVATKPEAPQAAAPASRARKGKGGRLARRSPGALAKTKAEIVALLAKHPKGLRAEEIRAKLGLSKQEVPRPISDALAEKLITKKGEKRATTYFKK